MPVGNALGVKVRFKHYSISTEKTYIHWIKHYIFYHNKKHPGEMGKREIEGFLTHLAVDRKVSPSTQNQAFSAKLFLYKEVLGHKSVETTMIYTHPTYALATGVSAFSARHVVAEMNKGKVVSPLDM